MNTQKFLVKIKVVQIVSNTKRRKEGLHHLGKGYFEAHRLNPFNPLSYVFVIIAIPILLLAYGFIGLFDAICNPFKWD